MIACITQQIDRSRRLEPTHCVDRIVGLELTVDRPHSPVVDVFRSAVVVDVAHGYEVFAELTLVPRLFLNLGKRALLERFARVTASAGKLGRTEPLIPRSPNPNR